MDRIASLLGPELAQFAPLLLVGILGLFLILLSLPMLLRRERDPLDRLKEASHADAARAEEAKPTLRTASRDKLEKYSTFLEPTDEEEYSAIRLRLLQAGYRSKTAVRSYHFAQFALGMAALVVGAILALGKLASGDPSTLTLALHALGPGIAGYMLPKYWVTRRRQGRQEEITNGFPDALDLMLVCVEAGQSIDQAILRVSKEMRAGYPALADEFEIVSHEMKAGKDKQSVLRDMSERAGVTDVSSFVTVLIQSATFGTSIAEALRVYAGEMRDKRVMRAEEAANKLPTKMTLATMMLTVPPLLLILIGPSVHGISQTMANANFF